MSFRFQKRKNLIGNLVRLNLSAGGCSISVGVPGARFTVPIWGNRSSHMTIGAPGTGVSYTKRVG